MSTNNQFDEIIDFRQFFFKIIKNWFFFLLSLLLTFFVAYAYNRYTQELYLVETSILVKEDNTVLLRSSKFFSQLLLEFSQSYRFH